MTAPARLPTRWPSAAADEFATLVLRRSIAAGLLPDRPVPDWERFRSLRARVRATFVVPETSITPLMARVLYGIAHLAQPRRILGIGTSCGNALVWLAGPGFGPGGSYRGMRAVGMDTDATSTEVARTNFSRLGMDPGLELACMDGHLAADLAAGEAFDLLLLDADDPVRRKDVYLSLLDALYPCLAPGAIVVAHDICVPRFAEQLGRYLQAVADRDRFAGSLSLPVDACGLALSRTAAPGTAGAPGDGQ